MNTYEITYQVLNSNSGGVRETIDAASEQNARDVIRAKFSSQKVLILNSRMIAFGGGRDDDRRDGQR